MEFEKIKRFMMHPFTILVLSIILLDQVLKIIARSIAPFTVFPFLTIAKAQNTGVAFGILSNYGSSNFLFIIVSLLAICFMFYLFFSDQLGRKSRIGLTMMIAGGLANVLDRLFHGYVIDFIDIHFFSWHFATFNLADASISIGAVILIIFLFIEEKEMAVTTLGAKRRTGAKPKRVHSKQISSKKSVKKQSSSKKQSQLSKRSTNSKRKKKSGRKN